MPSQAGPLRRSHSAMMLAATSAPIAASSESHPPPATLEYERESVSWTHADAGQAVTRTRVAALLRRCGIEADRGAQGGADAYFAPVEFPRRDLDAEGVVAGHKVAG